MLPIQAVLQSLFAVRLSKQGASLANSSYLTGTPYGPVSRRPRNLHAIQLIEDGSSLGSATTPPLAGNTAESPIISLTHRRFRPFPGLSATSPVSSTFLARASMACRDTPSCSPICLCEWSFPINRPCPATAAAGTVGDMPAVGRGISAAHNGHTINSKENSTDEWHRTYRPQLGSPISRCSVLPQLHAEQIQLQWVLHGNHTDYS